VTDRARVLRVLQAVFVIAVLWFAVTLLAEQWAAVGALRESLHPSWVRVGLSGVIVLVSYAVLIATWRATVQAWGERIGVGDASRIWFVSNLGKYVPGKVWQIGAMGVMAQRVGVSPAAAVGSALVVSLVHVLVGFAVVAGTGRELLAGVAGGGALLPVALGVLAVAVGASPWWLPAALRLVSRVTGRTWVMPPLPPRAIWIAALGSATAWLLFGLAFRELAGAILGATTGDAATYVAVFTLSYLLGFVALFAPGGIGVRELSMAALLVSASLATAPEAALLVVASRLWLTVLEILPGALFLAWSPLRPASNP
jgi:hypothetical protein